MAFALTLPALACALFLFALLDRTWARLTKAIPWLPQRRKVSLSAVAFDEFTPSVNSNKTVELDQRRVEGLIREDESDGAPPRSAIDLTRGTAFIVVQQPAAAPSPRA
ncbi:DUF6191 domain-containing protein [Streptomyces sp. NPDC053079]|uniref:DUF6191 domain-containing protein n=1 Tax=Streptomyces sp. NPDC053079 TaxID=3365697 RepID=UPI0037CEA6FF